MNKSEYIFICLFYCEKLLPPNALLRAPSRIEDRDEVSGKLFVRIEATLTIGSHVKDWLSQYRPETQPALQGSREASTLATSCGVTASHKHYLYSNMEEDRDDALGVVLSKWGVTDARTALEAKLRAGDKISDTGRGRRPEAGR